MASKDICLCPVYMNIAFKYSRLIEFADMELTDMKKQLHLIQLEFQCNALQQSISSLGEGITT